MKESQALKLDFLVIGGQKCATTWLYDCLKYHPDIHLPNDKLESTYLGGDFYEQYGVRAYFEALGSPKSSQKLGQVSVEYLPDQRSPKAVFEHASKARIIVSIREPISRSISAFHWYVRKSIIPEMEIGEAMEMALNGLSKTNEGGDPYILDILQRSLYDVQIQRYLEFFSINQFLFVTYDEIKASPAVTLRRIFRFIGVDDGFVPSTLATRPKQNAHVYSLTRLQRLAPKSRILGKLVDVSNQMFTRWGIVGEKPILVPELKVRLDALFQPHNQRLSQMITSSSPLSSPLPDWLVKL